VDQWWIRSSAVAGALRPVVTGRAGRRGGGAAPHFGQLDAVFGPSCSVGGAASPEADTRPP
jgi:hypothetical protein